jgi:hypothetical protein
MSFSPGVSLAFLRSEEALSNPLPDDKTRHGVLVARGPAIFDIYSRQDVAADMGLIGVKVLVLKEQVPLRNEAAVDVAVSEVDDGVPVMVDVLKLLAGDLAERMLED